MTPENSQNHLLPFEEKRGEDIHFFPYMDFLLVYSRAKYYIRWILTGCCRNLTMKTLQSLYKNLFLFYGKRFFFYYHLPSVSRKCIFQNKRHSEYIDRYFNSTKYLPVILLHTFYYEKNPFRNLDNGVHYGIYLPVNAGKEVHYGICLPGSTGKEVHCGIYLPRSTGKEIHHGIYLPESTGNKIHYGIHLLESTGKKIHYGTYRHKSQNRRMLCWKKPEQNCLPVFFLFFYLFLLLIL